MRHLVERLPRTSALPHLIRWRDLQRVDRNLGASRAQLALDPRQCRPGMPSCER